MPAEPPAMPCQLCGQSFPRAGLTKHHCLPKAKGGTEDDVELICGQCHSMVHATFTNATLAVLYPTIRELRKAAELSAFIRWVRKQPAARRARTRPRKRKV